MISFVQI